MEETVMDEKHTASRKMKWLLRIVSTAAVVAWMTVIFLFSEDDVEKSTSKSDKVVDAVIVVAEDVHLVKPKDITPKKRDRLALLVRKGGHVTEYAVLGVLLMLALTAWGVKSLLLRCGIALGVAAAYAATDEYHQLSVSGRSGKFLDVGIDTGGAMVGIAIVWLIIFLRRRHKDAKRKTAPENGEK